ncbi:dynamin family protein [Halalkalibacter alkaliphilus]|uniref:Dynamin family protein n=1 Tax=Halalkalibacter alkaliphilus TaxID=2917993 RepID=A0A9X2CTZ6_9BACI|nr:dynamin family protein [Halalkalibacter alkaliphilus]MCL7748271.1 dynamin family protein [Halalkalibacter alkaliphilus]
MRKENELIKKHYYKHFVEERTNQPIAVLAEAMLKENEEETNSSIRYAQGEVYYHNKDYETAIFKWEKVQCDLKSWAMKNIADSYYEVGALSQAEEGYLAIHTENLILRTEIELQLFSLYMDQQQLDQAAKVIKNVVSLNPDYLDVTEIARSFFEEYRDWDSAIDLAINEAIRTESIEWFEIVQKYIDRELTKTIEPSYFLQALKTLYSIDVKKFEQIVVVLWKSYRSEGEVYFKWLTEFNDLLLQLNIDKTVSWLDLSKLYEQTYFDLTAGKYFIKEIEHIVPNLLSNWIHTAKKSQAVAAAGAVLSWNQLVSNLNTNTVNEAEIILSHDRSATTDSIVQSLELYESIIRWAQEHDLEIGDRIEWKVQQLVDFDRNYLVVAGSDTKGKTAMINHLLGHEVLSEELPATFMFRNGSETILQEINEEGHIHPVNEELSDIDLKDKMFEYVLPASFLEKNKLTILSTERNEELNNYAGMADVLLFIIDANSRITKSDYNVLTKIQDEFPSLSIHFVINKMNVIYNEQEVQRIVEETEAAINENFPNAQIYTTESRFDGLNPVISGLFKNRMIEKERNERMLKVIQETIGHLLEKRVKMEKNLMNSVTWNEEAVLKLTGANNQLIDIEKEKIQEIKESYVVITDEMKKNLRVNIPKILRECSSFIKEDSDFRNIHVELNRKMNEQISTYLEQTFLPKFSNVLQEWLEVCNVEFIQSQSYLKEMTEGFNRLYEKERFKLQCDFRVLDDWYRDVDRMTNGVHLENVNILLRLTPSQLLLKSSGKFFGVLPTNKALVFKMYKKFIENEEYKQVTETIMNQYMLQFDLFGKSIERDMNLFYRSPFSVLNEAIAEAQSEIEGHNDALDSLRANPEIYKDPLTLFKVRVHQYELMELRDLNKSQSLAVK